jgi:hypothetical protein
MMMMTWDVRKVGGGKTGFEGDDARARKVLRVIMET